MWMEIDLEDVTEDGDIREDGASGSVNCVRLHIPYAMLGGAPERDYFPTAFAIGQYLGWAVIDEQTGESLAASAARGQDAPRRKPWWKLW